VADFPTAVVVIRHWIENYAFMDEPVGWFRDPLTGRRRPDGDPDKEYIER
jgi:hypothetical protein